MSTRRCTYTFNFNEAAVNPHAKPDSELLDDAHVWGCPHPVLEGSEYCLAHTDPDDRPTDHVDESTWVVNRIMNGDTEGESSTSRTLFLGGEFQSLEIGSVRQSSERLTLDLRFTRIGRFQCGNSSFVNSVALSNASVDHLEMDGEFDSLEAIGATVNTIQLGETQFDHVDLRDAVVETANFQRSRVRELDARNIEASEININKSIIEYSNLDFLSAEYIHGQHGTFDIVDLDNAICQEMDFYYADFGQADFRNIAVVDSVLKGASLDGAYFNGAAIKIANWIGVEVDNGHFSDIQIEQGLLRNATIEEAGFTGAYLGWIGFDDSRIDKAEFQRATLEFTSFKNTEFEEANFTSTDCTGYLNLENTIFSRELHIAPNVEAPPNGAVVNLRRSEVADGVLAQPENGRVVYALQNATVGSVTFQSQAEDHNMIEDVFFLRTRFDGFDFRDGDDINLKKVNYKIHTMFDGFEGFVRNCLSYGPAIIEAKETNNIVSTPNWKPEVRQSHHLAQTPASNGYLDHRTAVMSDLSPEKSLQKQVEQYSDPSTADLEYTYLLAKNGANAIHDNESSSQFFIQEMLQRRQRYVDLMYESDQVSSFASHAVDWVKNSLLWWSSGYGERPSRVVVTSSVSIAAFTLLYYSIAPELYPDISEYVSLSIGSFVTLIIGGVSEVSNNTVRILTQIQAFFGAFMIAIFVFTLTRSIRR